MNDDLCYASATELIQGFRDGSISPVEVLTAQIERERAQGQDINAFSERLQETARESARDAEIIN